MESILDSIKKLLGIPENHNHFDTDISIHINSVFMILTQLGVGPSDGFSITDANAKWHDFVPSDTKNFESVKTYVYLKVKLLFDPPLSSAVIDSINRLINEYEWRLNAAAETTQTNEEENQNG